MKSRQVVASALVPLLFPLAAIAQPITVNHVDGYLSIQCDNAPLSEVFERIEQATGVELTLEDEIKSKRLTANLNAQPLPLAIQRLLEGAGVNYIVMMDPGDWQRVGKIFVGAGGGAAGRPAPPPRRAVPDRQPAEDYDAADDYDAGLPEDEFADEFAAEDDFDNMNGEQIPPDFVDPNVPPVPDGNFLAPTPNYNRSRFTPGLPRSTNPGQATSPAPAPGANVPPATYPFTDPFGRPIPVPPNLNPQQPGQQNQDPNRPPPQQPQQ